MSFSFKPACFSAFGIAATGPIPLFLLEVRQVEGPMGFALGEGVLVVAAVVRWPYREVSPSGGALTLVVAVGV